MITSFFETKMKMTENQNLANPSEPDIIKKHMSQMRILVDDVLNVLEKKRHDYGLSFDSSVIKHGGVAYEIALDWKIERVHSFLTKGCLKNESLEDALRDIIGYTLLFWRILKHENRD